MSYEPGSDSPSEERLQYDEDRSNEPLPPPPAKPPAWRGFVLPVAIVVAAVITGGAVLFAMSGDDDDASDRELPEVTVGETARETFEGYAEALELDTEAFGVCLEDSATGDRIVGHLQEGVSRGVGATPTIFVNNKLVVGAQPIAIMEELIEAELAGGPTSLDEYSADIQALAAMEPSRFAIVDEAPEFENIKFEGDEDSEVRVLEFSDFQCPFCRRFAIETLPTLLDTMGDDVAFGFVHFPIIDIHPNAGRAALAAECASEQDEFWRMHDLLFLHQAAWQDLP